jgi:predicted transposase/invertase (TIGR01784 family)
MFSNWDKVISRFALKEQDYLVDYSIYDIELVFVELPKFNKSLDELATLTDKWIYFLKTARSLEIVPEEIGEIPEIQKAFAIANQANLTRNELEDLEKREIYIHDQRNAITKAVNQAVKQQSLEIAKRLIDVGLDDETISQTTGLSLQEVQNLRVN